MPYHDGYFATGWWVMVAFMILVWVVIIVGIIWLVSYLARRPGPGAGTMTKESAMDILNKRYASGEINKDEYERMKRDISGG